MKHLKIIITCLICICFIPCYTFAYNDYDYDEDTEDYCAIYGHDWGYDYLIRTATIKRTGIVRYSCCNCGAIYDKYCSWSYSKAEDDCSIYQTYDVLGHSIVYAKSKSVTVKLENPVRGSIVKVKIGKKTFKKKVGSKKKIKVKIKKPTVGKHVSIKVYYKGHLIGTAEDLDYEYDRSRVFSGKKIRKGMTKKQVKQLYKWSEVEDTDSDSSGYTYWYCEDGSTIVFRKGRVKYWRKE